MKVSGISYPDSVVGILDDKRIRKSFIAYAKSALIMENVNFLIDSQKTKNYKALFLKFISASGKTPINVSSDIRQECTELAEDEDWDGKKWKGKISSLRREIIDLVDLSSKDNFYKSDAFKEVLQAHLKAKIKVSKAQLAELKVDKKDSDAVKDMAALFIADKKAGAKAATALAKKKKTKHQSNAFIKIAKKVFRIK